MLVQRLVCLGLLLFAAARSGGELTTPAPSPTPAAASSATVSPFSPDAISVPTALPAKPVTATQPASQAPSTALPAAAAATSTPGKSVEASVLAKPSPSTQPVESVQATPAPAWQVETLQVAPGEPGRLYALMKDSSGPLWAFPASAVRLMISDDFAVTWAPFPVGLWRSPNPNTADVADVQWELVTTSARTHRLACGLGMGPAGVGDLRQHVAADTVGRGRRKCRQPGAPPLAGRRADVEPPAMPQVQGSIPPGSFTVCAMISPSAEKERVLGHAFATRPWTIANRTKGCVQRRPVTGRQ